MLASVSRVLARSAVASSSSAAAFSTAATRYAPKPAAKKAGPAVKSSLQAGKVMQGLSVLKDKPDPVALPDDQYPAWLWTILDEAPKTSPEGEFDFLTERRRLRANNRTAIKAANYLKTT